MLNWDKRNLVGYHAILESRSDTCFRVISVRPFSMSFSCLTRGSAQCFTGDCRIESENDIRFKAAGNDTGISAVFPKAFLFLQSTVLYHRQLVPQKTPLPKTFSQFQ